LISARAPNLHGRDAVGIPLSGLRAGDR